MYITESTLERLPAFAFSQHPKDMGMSGQGHGFSFPHIVTSDAIKLSKEVDPSGSGYQQKDRKPSQNDKTEHGMEKTVQNQGQSPKMSKSESILKNQQSNRSRN
ncbi:hypothetical protein Tco_1390643 [Tanacetum coccineum]